MVFGKRPSNKLETFNFLYTGIIIFIFIALLVTAGFNQGRPGYNQDVLRVFGFMAAAAGVIALAFATFQVANFVKRRTDEQEIPFKAGFVSESTDVAPLSKSFLGKFGLQAVWVIVVVLLSSTGFQIWAAPDIYSGSVEFATATTDNPLSNQPFGIVRSVWDVAILPGFTEDMISLGFSAFNVFVFSLILLFVRMITKNNFFKYNIVWHTLFVLIACPIAAVGVGFIPGFAQAHTSVAGGNIAFLFATFFFQTINLYVMWFTSFFFPLAHIVHNGIFIFGFAVAFSVALITIPIIRNNHFLKHFLPIFNFKNQVSFFGGYRK